jgi:hypothetical protein
VGRSLASPKARRRRDRSKLERTCTGLYVTTGGVVSLHKSTVALNFASTSNNDIYGTVTYV